jgi:hypothetical protein
MILMGGSSVVITAMQIHGEYSQLGQPSDIIYNKVFSRNYIHKKGFVVTGSVTAV